MAGCRFRCSAREVVPHFCTHTHQYEGNTMAKEHALGALL
jgi:hypothetical protein